MLKNLRNLDSFSHQFPPVLSSTSLGWQDIEATHYLLPPDHVFLEQKTPSHLLVLYLGERSVLTQDSFASGDGTLADAFVNKGDYALAPAGSKVGARWSMDVDALFLYFDAAFIRSIVEASDIDASRVELLSHSFVHDHLVEHFGLALLHEVHSSGFNTRLYAESLANTFALHLLRHSSNLQPRKLRVTRDLSQRRLRHVLDYLHTYYTQDPSVAELAAIAQVSPSHFAHLFRTIMGMAPHEYLVACRVEHAKRLLLTEDIPLHEVAYHCGFADQSHLTRHFRRLVGVTPSVLRQEHRNVFSVGSKVQDTKGGPILSCE